uniref:lamin tail domain-containing protein n=1 Tax=Ideonella sp. B508-1 TaxID=137716 RepID=UPI000477CC5D
MKLHPLAAAIAALMVCAAPLAQASTSGVVISQFYGGGGNSGATLKNDFVELYNAGTSAVSLAGWSLQYNSSTGTGTWQVTTLPAVTLQPGQYFLVQEAQGSGGTDALPTPDATGTIAMSATSGKVALLNSTVALSGATPSSSALVDLVGFGSANWFEGAVATAPSNTSALLRAASGCPT